MREDRAAPRLGPSGGDTRAVSTAQGRLLEILRSLDGPATLVQLSEASGLHVNTVRGHLDALRDRGRVTRLRGVPLGRGRPAWSYVAREAPYAALAEALATGLESGPGLPPAEAALHGGREWGARLRDRLDLTGQEPHERVLVALDHVGFRPQLGDDGGVRLTHCPFIDAARAHPEAVCSVHRGLVEGALGSAIDPTALKPFAEPGACIVDLG